MPNLTPVQLRENAAAKIEEAQLLVENGLWLGASGAIGMAAEIFLKARFCNVHGWTDFPGDIEELKRRGLPAKGLFTHNLDELLTLSKSVRIGMESLSALHFDALDEWNIEQRYQAVGSVSPETAKLQLEQASRLIRMLAIYTTVEQLERARIEIEAAHGPLAFLALRLEKEGAKAQLFAPWAPRGADADACVAEFKALVAARLDEDLLDLVTFEACPPEDPAMQAITRSLQVGPNTGLIEIQFGKYHGHHVQEAYLLASAMPLEWQRPLEYGLKRGERVRVMLRSDLGSWHAATALTRNRFLLHASAGTPIVAPEDVATWRSY